MNTKMNYNPNDSKSIENYAIRLKDKTFLEEVCKYIQQILAEEGYESVTPAIDPRFTMLLGNHEYMMFNLLSQEPGSYSYNDAYKTTIWSRKRTGW